MKYTKIFILSFLIGSCLSACERNKEDFSGIYCINIQNMEMNIIQNGNNITFTMQSQILVDGTGTVNGDTLRLHAFTQESEDFISLLTFSKDRKSFSGPFQIRDATDKITLEGILLGTKGECIKYDIVSKGIPKFITKDFTQLSKIERISKFRSGFGHSFTDGSESCRNMKHYYNPYLTYRINDNVEIYSPVTGTILSVVNDGHGASIGLKNKQIQIRPDDQKAFVIVIFHCDPVSSSIITGKKVQEGELLGYARMYYDDLKQYVTSFDIAVWVTTPLGPRLVPYFDTLKDEVFNSYISRGALTRQDFTITKESRDADPLTCDGESFVTNGTINNWVDLN